MKIRQILCLLLSAALCLSLLAGCSNTDTPQSNPSRPTRPTQPTQPTRPSFPTNPTQPTNPNSSSQSSTWPTESDAPIAPTWETTPSTPPDEQGETSTEESQSYIDIPEQIEVNLGYGIRISQVGKYTGMYMEDGSNEFVSDVLMILVTNDTPDDLQFAQIQLSNQTDVADFELTTLPAGESLVVLEKNRKPYSEGYSYAVANHITFFPEPMGLMEDRIEISTLENILNVHNLTQQDIPGPIHIYYKNTASGQLYGGITYRITLDEGLAAGQIQQLVSSHFSTASSKIMFVTCGE